MHNHEIVLNNIKKRRSIRRFSDKEIDENDLNLIFEAARWAPSNCNKQLWKIVVIKDKFIKEKLVNEAGSSTLILRAPVILCMTHYNDVLLESYQTASAVVENMLLMATSLDIGSLWLNSKGNPKEIKRLLKIPKKYIITNFVLLGHYIKEKTPSAPKRKSLKHFIMYDKFTDHEPLNWTHNPKDWSYDALKNYQEFICRKTALGTCQDVFNQFEIDVVKNISKQFKSSHLDFFPYDGHILKTFAKNLNFTIIETSQETANYTKETLQDKTVKVVIFDTVIDASQEKYETMSINFRLERLPYDLRSQVFDFAYKHLTSDGKLFIVSRTNNLFYTFFYKLLIMFLSDNISKTAIFSFFGPYKPLAVNEAERMLQKAGFSVQKKRLFTIPTLFETIAQLMGQYRKSGGGNFMHRKNCDTPLSKIFRTVNIFQKKLHLHFLGSIVVYSASKNKLRS